MFDDIGLGQAMEISGIKNDHKSLEDQLKQLQLKVNLIDGILGRLIECLVASDIIKVNKNEADKKTD